MIICFNFIYSCSHGYLSKLRTHRYLNLFFEMCYLAIDAICVINTSPVHTITVLSILCLISEIKFLRHLDTSCFDNEATKLLLHPLPNRVS